MKRKKPILILKASGQYAPFSADKLKESLARAGAEEDVINRIVPLVESKLSNGISTRKIYRQAYNLLKQDAGHLAARYQLKKAIMELGPSGYPFEKFIGELFIQQGFKVKIGQIVRGKCVSHEVDVIAVKGNRHLMIECKYHNLPGVICDVKIPLYIQARFKDVEFMWQKLSGHSTAIHEGWVVTNTRFSTDAIQYAECAGLHLMGWDYPSNGSLKELIDKLGLYPITCLTTLSQHEKQLLLGHKIVLCKEISENPKLLNLPGLSADRKDTVLKEICSLTSIVNASISESELKQVLDTYH